MTDLPDIKLKAIVQFPANIDDGTGIDVTKTNGRFRFDLAYDDFTPPLTTVADPAHSVMLIWNTVSGAYGLAPTSLLLGSGSAFPSTADPIMDGVAAPGASALYSRGDHVHPTDTSRAATSHSHTASSITDFSEAVDDRVGSLLVAGTNITLNYNDAANTLTVTSTGGGAAVLVSDTPPVGAADNTLWWESDSGMLYIRYNDGTSTQWVAATIGPAGPPGATGVTGPPGATGATGPQGPTGTVSGVVAQNPQSSAYTTVLGDAGGSVFHPATDTTARTWTIAANSSVAYAVGTLITFINQNGAGVITIAITSDTLRLAGTGATGSRTLAANGMATANKVTTTEWLISGSGLT